MSYIQIGPKVDGKQSITLAKEGYVPVTYMSTPEKIDAFTKEANIVKSQQSKRNNINIAVGTFGMGIIGALLPFEKTISGRFTTGALGGVLGLALSLLLCMYQQTKMYDKPIDNFIKNNK